MSEYLSATAILMLVLSPLIIPLAVAVMHGLARGVSTARAAGIQAIESAQTASRKRPQPVTAQLTHGRCTVEAPGMFAAEHRRPPTS